MEICRVKVGLVVGLHGGNKLGADIDGGLSDGGPSPSWESQILQLEFRSAAMNDQN